MEEKRPRNKTIRLGAEEGKKYLERCVRLVSPAPLAEVLDRTILGDTFGAMPLLPRGFADLIIADPPYNLTKKFGGSVFARRAEEEYEEYTRKWISLAEPLLREGGTVYVCCDWASSMAVGKVLKEFFTVRNRITWQREKGRGAKANWKNSMEDIWFATKGEGYTFDLDAVKVRRRVVAPYRENGAPKDWTATAEGNFRDTCPSNFWDDITVPFWSMPENTEHPTQKPEKLYAKLILASSREGDVVFDPFLGSGTASVTAKKLKRHYVGIESQERYCVFAEKRLEDAEKNKSVQGYEEGVFWERNAAPGRKTSKEK